jgi:hypothetical protein
MNRPLRFTLIWASLVAALAVLAPLAPADGRVFYVSPSTGGVTCSEAAPCSLEFAIDEAVDGDKVVVGPGTYNLLSPQGLFEAIDIGGANPADKPVIKTTASNTVFTGAGKSLKIHDLRIEGTGGLVLNQGVAERVFVSYTGISASGCSVNPGAALLDSVCWAHNPASASAAIQSTIPAGEGTATLRNVTAISTTESEAIFAKASSGGVLKLNAFNVIARASNDRDISTELSGPSSVVVTLTNSSYSTVEGSPSTTVTTPGTNGNQTAAPAFLDAVNGDFREAAGSPTVEAGLTDPLNGALGIAGEARVLGLCVGGPGVTDVGAYEFVPTAACPQPPSNIITLGKLKLNKKNGTATLVVTVPDAGKLILSGKGLKKVTRTTKGKATLKLPVKPVGKSRKRLRANGKLKVSLKLKFVPTGGSARQTSKKATLKMNTH